MFARKLKHDQYVSLLQWLDGNAPRPPWDASYDVRLKVNDAFYRLRVQPENDDKIAALQAVRFESGAYCLITESRLLSSLMELFFYQEVCL